MKQLPGVRQDVYHVNAYVPGKTIEEVRREYDLDDVIKLGSNENPYGPYPGARKAMIEAVESINIYPETTFLRLKTSIASVYGLGPENVAIGHGAGGVLETVAKTFLGPEDHVLVPRETYGLYKEISRLLGAEVQRIGLTPEYRVDVPRIIEAIRPTTKLVWLCNPNNPTGTVVDPADIDRLLEALPSTGWLILDEAYAEFAAEEELPDRRRLIESGARIVAVRTFSKAYALAGARIGYALGSPDLIQALDTVAEPFNANRVGLVGAHAVLTEDREHVSEAIRRIRESRVRLEGALRARAWRVVAGRANFVFAVLPDSEPRGATEVALALLKRGVILRSAEGWGYPRGLRISVGTPQEIDRLLKEVDALNG